MAAGGGHGAFYNPMHNLRTLCTPCHVLETAKLRLSLKELADAQAAVNSRDIRSFFGGSKESGKQSQRVVVELD